MYIMFQYGTMHCTATEGECIVCTIREYCVESGRRAKHASCHSPTGRLLFAVSRKVEVVSQVSAKYTADRKSVSEQQRGFVWA